MARAVDAPARPLAPPRPRLRLAASRPAPARDAPEPRAAGRGHVGRPANRRPAPPSRRPPRRPEAREPHLAPAGRGGSDLDLPLQHHEDRVAGIALAGRAALPHPARAARPPPPAACAQRARAARGSGWPPEPPWSVRVSGSKIHSLPHVWGNWRSSIHRCPQTRSATARKRRPNRRRLVSTAVQTYPSLALERDARDTAWPRGLNSIAEIVGSEAHRPVAAEPPAPRRRAKPRRRAAPSCIPSCSPTSRDRACSG